MSAKRPIFLILTIDKEVKMMFDNPRFLNDFDQHMIKNRGDYKAVPKRLQMTERRLGHILLSQSTANVYEFVRMCREMGKSPRNYFTE